MNGTHMKMEESQRHGQAPCEDTGGISGEALTNQGISKVVDILEAGEKAE